MLSVITDEPRTLFPEPNIETPLISIDKGAQIKNANAAYTCRLPAVIGKVPIAHKAITPKKKKINPKCPILI